MGLTSAQIAQLNNIESEMARKGFTLGSLIDTSLDATQAAAEATAAAASEQLSPAASADPGDAGSLSASAKLEELTSGGSGETRVLPAPAAGFVGLKVIRFDTDGGGDIVIDAGNVLGFTTEDFTLANEGDTIVLIANGGAKWVQIGGNITPA